MSVLLCRIICQLWQDLFACQRLKSDLGPITKAVLPELGRLLPPESSSQ